MSQRSRILFINRSYWPDAEATGQLLTELCEDLADQFEVTVIAGQPNHNAEQADFRSRGTQRRHGVTIRRVFHTRLPKATFIGRIVNFVTFLIGATALAFTSPKPDVVVVETDPPLLCLLGAWLQRWRGCRLVVYLQDINPDIAVALGKIRAGRLANMLRRRFAKIYQRADRVVVLSDDMRSVMEAWDVPEDRIATIPNWVDTDIVYPVKNDNRFRNAQKLSDHFVVMYSGNLGLCQQLDDVLLAAELLRDRPEIQFVLVGQGASKARLQQFATNRGLCNVRFLDYQPKGELSTSLSAADLQLVPLDSRIVKFMMPSKLYGILACGTPVIAVAPEECELSRIVRSERVGYVTPAGDAAALANQIRECADNRAELQEMGDRARKLAVECFDRKSITERFGCLLSEVLGTAQATTVARTTQTYVTASSLNNAGATARQS